MGFFSSLGSAISSAVSSVCSCVGRVCSGIAGALGGSFLGNAVSSFVSKIGLSIPGVNIIEAIIVVAQVVVAVAEVLGLKNKGENEPDELAMKAEKDDMKPDDFDSVSEYIKHLQEEVKLTGEDKEKLKNMSAEERSAYTATGTYLYTKALCEKLGFETDGLKNPELAGITVELLADLAKLAGALSPSEFVAYTKYLMSAGLSMKQFSDYLHNRSENFAVDSKVQGALIDGMKEIYPDINDKEIYSKLCAMNAEE